MDYPGKVITKTQVTPTQTSASGNWTLDDQAAAIKNNNWPVALVPNPISKSLRFNSADTAYLNRTPASTSNQKKWTWSGWVKRGVLSTFGGLMSGYVDANNYTTLYFWNDNTITFYQTIGGSAGGQIATSAVFRDPSAWYHIVIVYDSANATQANRVLIYVNGVQQTLTTTTAITLNTNSLFNVTTATQNLGRHGAGSNYFDGYLTEVNFIDGQQLTPSDFGLTNPQTGQWIPKKYTGTYGTNGFYLNFKDATSTTTLGYDYSGNANNWTTNNFSVTAGVGNDSLTDVPTPWIAYNTTGDVGGVVRGNYCTLNPLDEPATYAAAGSSANGNLDFSVSNDAAMGSTISVSSGKWYWEMTVVSGHSAGANTVWAAIASSTPSSVNKLPYQSGSGGRSYATTGLKFNENSSSSYGNTYTNGDVIGCALDLDNGKVYWSKNGTFQASGDPVAGTNAAFTGLTGTWLPVASSNTPLTSFNFGQRPFAYTPPTGFRSLCTTNLPATAIGFGLTNQGDDYFNAVLWTGDGTSTRSITGVGFQPDWVWIKSRNNAITHRLSDAVRGANKVLYSNLTNAEDTNDNNGYTSSFDSDGFTLTAGSTNSNATNASTYTYVAWNWKASNAAGVTNTSGTITSTVSANTTSGFSIVTYTGVGNAGDTVGHGLGVAPSMIFIKWRTGGTTQDWIVYHASIGATKFLELNTTDAEATSSTRFNDTTPSSTVFTLGTNSTVNASTYTYVAYCFAAVAGYSAFGSYTGNGSADGPFVYTGFRPKFVLHKCSSLAGDGWLLYDTVRQTYNVVGAYLQPNLSNAEGNTTVLDILSNGFKLRSTFSSTNSNGATYIYAAFAESPFQFANAR
jgi:hypothetical protein